MLHSVFYCAKNCIKFDQNVKFIDICEFINNMYNSEFINNMYHSKSNMIIYFSTLL